MTFHSPSCLPKLICSTLVVGAFITGVFLKGAYPHSNFINKLLQPDRNNQTKSTTSTFYSNQASNETESQTFFNIQAANQELQPQLEQTLARIMKTMEVNKDLATRISRSPRATKTLQALEAAIAILNQDKHDPEYQLSEYATGNRHWRRSPAQHPVPIQDLLLDDIQKKNNPNKLLGDKVAKIVQQNTKLAKEIASVYKTPLEKLKKDPIMGLVTKTVATCMFLKHNGNKHLQTEDFASWGSHFSKRRSEGKGKNKNKRNVITEVTTSKMSPIKRTKVKANRKELKRQNIKSESRYKKRTEVKAN